MSGLEELILFADYSNTIFIFETIRKFSGEMYKKTERVSSTDELNVNHFEIIVHV